MTTRSPSGAATREWLWDAPTARMLAPSARARATTWTKADSRSGRTTPTGSADWRPDQFRQVIAGLARSTARGWSHRARSNAYSGTGRAPLV